MSPITYYKSARKRDGIDKDVRLKAYFLTSHHVSVQPSCSFGPRDREAGRTEKKAVRRNVRRDIIFINVEGARVPDLYKSRPADFEKDDVIYLTPGCLCARGDWPPQTPVQDDERVRVRPRQRSAKQALRIRVVIHALTCPRLRVRNTT